MTEFVITSSSQIIHDGDGRIRIQPTVPGPVEGFDLRNYTVKVIVERIPIPDGILFANNEECELLYVKKDGVWYAVYNFGHKRATENADAWDGVVNVTDDWVRENCYELKPAVPDQ